MFQFFLDGLHGLSIESDEWREELLKGLSLGVFLLLPHHLIGRRAVLLVSEFNGLLHGSLTLCTILSWFLWRIGVDDDAVFGVVRTVLLLLSIETHVS